MRWQTRVFVKKFLEEKKIQFVKVLDVGSRSVDNQATIRDLFAGGEYMGLDMIKGVNVNLVLNAHDIKTHFKEGSFDLVCCFDTLEHDEAFWITVENMKWVLKKGGWLLIGVPSLNCGQHDYPNDYYRWLENGVKKMFEGFINVYTETQLDNPSHRELDEIYGWGQKI